MKLFQKSIAADGEKEKQMANGIIPMISASEAIQLLEEAITRIKNKHSTTAQNARDGWQCGGAYWRIMTALTKHVAPQLVEQEGAAHAMSLMSTHGMAIPFTNKLLPDRVDSLCPVVNEHFSFYETIVDANELANFRQQETALITYEE